MRAVCRMIVRRPILRIQVDRSKDPAGCCSVRPARLLAVALLLCGALALMSSSLLAPRAVFGDPPGIVHRRDLSSNVSDGSAVVGAAGRGAWPIARPEPRSGLGPGGTAGIDDGDQLALLLQRSSTPLPDARAIARLDELLALDEAQATVLGDLVAAAQHHRRERMVAILASPEALRVLDVVDRAGGRPSDDDLLPVGSDVVLVSRALRAADDDSHAQLHEDFQRILTPVQAGRWPEIDALLRRRRNLDRPFESRKALGTGIDLVEFCATGSATIGREPRVASRLPDPSAVDVLRRFDDRPNDPAGAFAPSEPPSDPLPDLARRWAGRLDAALRELERTQESLADAAERSVTQGDRAEWRRAIESRRAATRRALRVGEEAADAIAAELERRVGPESALRWRNVARRAAHPTLFPDDAQTALRDMVDTAALEPDVRDAVDGLWLEFLRERELASARILALLLDGADPRAAVAPPAAKREEGGASPQGAVRTLRLSDAFQTKFALESRLRIRMLELVPPTMVEQSAVPRSDRGQFNEVERDSREVGGEGGGNDGRSGLHR